MFERMFKCFMVIMLLSQVACSSIESRSEQDNASYESSERQRILLVNTNARVERYSIAESSFSSLFDQNDIKKLDLASDSEPLELLLDELNTGSYDAIYSIGAKSLALIDYIAPEIPVVYNSVLDWRRFQGNESYYGVASEISLIAQLTWFKHFFPELQSLGVIYSETNSGLISEARALAERLGIDLLAVQVEKGRDVHQEAANLMSEVQALWLISDIAVLSSEERVKQLFELADRNRVPVLTYDDLFIQMGALLSIAADLPTMGRQAALIMRDVLMNNQSQIKPIVYPAGSRIILNQATLEESGLPINEDALDSVNDIRY